MNTKKYLSILTSVLMLSGAFAALPKQAEGTALFPAPMIAEAATVNSGKTSKISYAYNSDVTLYFTQDASDHHLEVCGSKITNSNSEVKIPSTVNVNGVNYPVTAIAHHAFQGQTNLKSIYLNSLPIGGAAFYGCSNLQYVFGTINSVPDCAFYGCSKLSDITFTLNATHIGAHAFWGCSTISIVAFNQLSSLGIAAFYDCSNLESIDFSATSLSAIPDFAFHNCSNLKKISLPESLTSIGTQAFSICDSLEQIYIPDAVTTIGTAAFMQCGSLKTVMMSENIASIGDHAFFECPSMKYFVSKNPSVSIGEWAIGWHLENTLPVRNTDFILWSPDYDTVYQYAHNNGFTFCRTGAAASMASVRYVDYEWTRSNNSAWAVNHNYYFSDAHLPFAKKKNNTHFNGICNGMAIVSALTSSGYLAVSDYAPGYTKLRDIKNISAPSALTSYVTTVWANSFSTHTIYDDYKTDFTTHNFSKEMLRYAEYITYGADAAVFVIDNYNNTNKAHGTVCFGMEFQEDASDKNDACWNGWDARLMIYNVNRTKHDKQDYVYVNLSDGSWSSNLNVGLDGTVGPCYFTMVYSYNKMIQNTDNNLTAAEFFNEIKLS